LLCLCVRKGQVHRLQAEGRKIGAKRTLTMNLFRRPDYRSDTTQFIDQLKAAKPQVEEGQRQGRALLWDKALDRETQAGFQAARVAQKPYVYQSEH
jgi:hypothetical protein